jgi:hypothetical protein
MLARCILLIFFLIQIGVAVILFFLPSQLSKLLGRAWNSRPRNRCAMDCAFIATFVVPRLAAKFDRLRLFGALSLCIGFGGFRKQPIWRSPRSASPWLESGLLSQSSEPC